MSLTMATSAVGLGEDTGVIFVALPL